MSANFNLRNINPEVMTLLKREASNRNISVNSLILKFLEQELGIAPRRRKPHFNDLDDLAGTWSENDTKKFQAQIKFFEQVDQEMW